MDYESIILTFTITILVILVFFSLIMSIKGPRRADRIMSINMVGSFSSACIAILAIYLKEPWLLDVCLIYCLISFLAVVILTKVSIINKDIKEK